MIQAIKCFFGFHGILNGVSGGYLPDGNYQNIYECEFCKRKITDTTRSTGKHWFGG